MAKSFEAQFLDAVSLINNAVFTNNQENASLNLDALDVYQQADLVYMDPPYYSPLSDNEYVRRYHFVEGLARNWEGVEIQVQTKTKKFKSYPTPFSSHEGARKAFEALFDRFSSSIIVVSYSSNSLPSKAEMVEMLSRFKKNVEIIPIDHRYSFGTQSTAKRNKVKEYLFIGY